MFRYSDDHYRASLVSALYSSVSASSGFNVTITPDPLVPEIRQILKELTLALNMDTMKPSFGRVVGIAALTGIYHVGFIFSVLNYVLVAKNGARST